MKKDTVTRPIGVVHKVPPSLGQKRVTG